MNSVSEPPINISEKEEAGKVTFADVAMRVARDGPMYAIIIMIGALALKGSATAMETMMTSAIALLARSWPGAIQMGKGMMGKNAGLLLVLGGALGAAHLVMGCV